MQQVARAAGVSVATVSVFLSKTRSVSSKLQTRIEQAIEAVGYQPNGVARSLRKGRTRTIGLVVADLTSPFHTAIMQTVQQIAAEHDYAVIMCGSDDQFERERTQLKVLQSRMIDGLILMPAGRDEDYQQFRSEFRMPLVLIDRLPQSLHADSVMVDNTQATRRAVAYLAGLGHRHIGFAGGQPWHLTGRDRLLGYREALKEAGIAYDGRLVVESVFTQREGFAAANQLLALARRPSAIFAASNATSIGVMLALHDAKLACPTDVSVACFDDFDWAEAFQPRLTTVAQPTSGIAEAAMSMLFQRLDGTAESITPRRIVLQAELRIRDSCIAPPR